ncbi:unnamed protein product [Effrenium voratum]|nr:unnamed protein product [Effrenium voratum]
MRWSLLPAVFVTLAAADNVWSEVTATGGPAELEYPSAVWDEANKRMLTFGGGDNSDAFHDSVFSLEDSTWTDISTSGTGPAGRYRQAIALDGSRMFVFGGSSEDRHKDLFALDLTTYAWSSLDDGDELFGHSMLWDSQNSRLLVFGGQKGASEQYRDQLMEWKSAEETIGAIFLQVAILPASVHSTRQCGKAPQRCLSLAVKEVAPRITRTSTCTIPLQMSGHRLQMAQQNEPTMLRCSWVA